MSGRLTITISVLLCSILSCAQVCAQGASSAGTNKLKKDSKDGLCLSATYDAAFDKHLISFDDNYRMIVGKNIKDYYTNDVVKEYFEKFEGKQITLPKFFLPNKELLSKHRESLV